MNHPPHVNNIIVLYIRKQSLACYHGVAALGHALGDPVIELTGQAMLATELHSVRSYYTVRDDNLDHFPPHILDYGAIGMFAEDNIFLYTLNWPCAPEEFPMRHACLIGIQILPITSISHLYMDQVSRLSARLSACAYSSQFVSFFGASRDTFDANDPTFAGFVGS